MKKRDVIIFVVLSISLIILDYINLPSLFGFKMYNINWDFYMGILNTIVVVALYVITYKILDEKTIEREKNKNTISLLLMQESYKECIKSVKFLNQEIIEKYIVTKIDFNVIDKENMIVINIQNSPFVNENIIMDLVKDGQVTAKQIKGYLKVREQYKQYISTRIAFFDAPDIYESFKIDLFKIINDEIKKLDNQI